MDNNWNNNNTYSGDNQGQFSSQTDMNMNAQNPYQQNPYQAQQNGYQPYAPYPPYTVEEKEEPVKLSEYLLICLFCTFLPCVGVILLFVFGFSQNEKQSKKNFCRAMLITYGISFALALVVGVIYGAALFAILQ